MQNAGDVMQHSLRNSTYSCSRFLPVKMKLNPPWIELHSVLALANRTKSESEYQQRSSKGFFFLTQAFRVSDEVIFTEQT